ncbi:hypothetical protein GCM10010129_35790 [Streptomyces fumigatiscleroticus]|nr:hypothetical protein GCM10010129_35790 [Streptomyces fumigatiscleroticus]
MAFGVAELRVLRRALALALNPRPVSAEDVQDCLRLAESLDEVAREGARLRAFLVADLARYRAALPGATAGYLALLDEALGAGHRPDADDLAALRALRGNPAAASLLHRCAPPAEPEAPVRPADGATAPAVAALPDRSARPAVRPDAPARFAARATAPAAAASGAAGVAGGTGTTGGIAVVPTAPASRTRLQALPGGLSRGPAGGPSSGAGAVTAAGQDPAGRPGGKPEPRPDPAAPKPAPAAPRRPVPTPGEVFPRRRPGPPPPGGGQRLAAG